MKACWVYLLRCADGTLYTGWTDDPAARLAAHNSGKGAKYTRARLPVQMVYREWQADKSAALRREIQIKRMSRTEKLRLIAGQKEMDRLEIERKWLIEGFPEGLQEVQRAYVEQTYLCTAPVVRVRMKRTEQACSYMLCFKGRGTLAREEIELPLEEADYRRIEALALAPPIRKEYRVYALPEGLLLECSLVDAGTTEAFYYAEVEFETVEAAIAFTPPAFLGRELTEEPGWSMSDYWLRTRKHTPNAAGD